MEKFENITYLTIPRVQLFFKTTFQTVDALPQQFANALDPPRFR
jgi:hypothetical protein